MATTPLPPPGSPPATHSVASSAGPAPAAPYLTATETLRATVRWLVTAAAGVGGVLVAGLQLTGLGSLGSEELLRLALALGGLFVALAAVGYMIMRASQILTDEWVTLADLQSERFDRRIRQDPQDPGDGSQVSNPHQNSVNSRLSKIRDKILRQLRTIRNRRDRQRSAVINSLYERLDLIREELFGSLAADISDLYARLMEANEQARRNPESPRAGSTTALQQAAGTVVAFANFYITRESFKTLRRQLAGASGVVVLGVLVFAYAANPPEPSSTVDKPAAVSPSSPSSPSPSSGSTSAPVPPGRR